MRDTPHWNGSVLLTTGNFTVGKSSSIHTARKSQQSSGGAVHEMKHDLGAPAVVHSSNATHRSSTTSCNTSLIYAGSSRSQATVKSKLYSVCGGQPGTQPPAFATVQDSQTSPTSQPHKCRPALYQEREADQQSPSAHPHE